MKPLCLFTLMFFLALGELSLASAIEDDGTDGRVGEDGIQRVTLKMTSYAFLPDRILIQAGRPVELTLQNDSFLVPHNFVISHEAMGLHHDVSVGAGDAVTVQLLLTTPGQYSFYCDKQLLFFDSHREKGMEGVLEVRSELTR